MEKKTYSIECKNYGKTQIERSYSKTLFINKKQMKLRMKEEMDLIKYKKYIKIHKQQKINVICIMKNHMQKD